jgi:hypothetical protein
METDIAAVTAERPLVGRLSALLQLVDLAGSERQAQTRSQGQSPAALFGACLLTARSFVMLVVRVFRRAAQGGRYDQQVAAATQPGDQEAG